MWRLVWVAAVAEVTVSCSVVLWWVERTWMYDVPQHELSWNLELGSMNVRSVDSRSVLPDWLKSEPKLDKLMARTRTEFQ